MEADSRARDEMAAGDPMNLVAYSTYAAVKADRDRLRFALEQLMLACKPPPPILGLTTMTELASRQRLDHARSEADAVLTAGRQEEKTT